MEETELTAGFEDVLTGRGYLNRQAAKEEANFSKSRKAQGEVRKVKDQSVHGDQKVGNEPGVSGEWR